MGTRPAAEVHLQHALSIAKELGKEEEARVWLQCGLLAHPRFSGWQQQRRRD